MKVPRKVTAYMVMGIRSTGHILIKVPPKPLPEDRGTCGSPFHRSMATANAEGRQRIQSDFARKRLDGAAPFTNPSGTRAPGPPRVPPFGTLRRETQKKKAPDKQPLVDGQSYRQLLHVANRTGVGCHLRSWIRRLSSSCRAPILIIEPPCP